MAVISAQVVRDELRAMARWSRAKSERAGVRFPQRQPAVTAYVLAAVEEEGREATGFALEVVTAVENIYRQALGRAPRRITAAAMDAAADAARKTFADLVGVEPELALRRFLYHRDHAEAELFAELARWVMEECHSDEELEPALGAIFLTVKAVALAYECANGLARDDVTKGSLGEVIEAQIGHPLPKIGRNDPCPCGTGKKFKQCCGSLPQENGAAAVRISGAPFSDEGPGVRRLKEYLALMEGLSLFAGVVAHQPDGRWLRKQIEKLNRTYRAGHETGAPDSMLMCYSLLDVPMPRSGCALVELFIKREARRLNPPAPQLLRHLADSYVNFYELLGRDARTRTKRMRELVSGVIWNVTDPSDPTASGGEVGEISLCRLVGEADDAVVLSPPLVYAPEARGDFERMVQALIQAEVNEGLPAPEALRRGMKKATPYLAEYVCYCEGEEHKMES